jgi:hypothetical protein
MKYLKYYIYPKGMSTPNIYITCLAITVESSTSFKASSLVQAGSGV